MNRNTAATAAALGMVAAAAFAGGAAACFIRAQNCCECDLPTRGEPPRGRKASPARDKLLGAAQTGLGAASRVLHFLERVTSSDRKNRAKN